MKANLDSKSNHSDRTTHSLQHDHLDENMPFISIIVKLFLNMIQSAVYILFYYIHDLVNLYFLGYKGYFLQSVYGLVYFYSGCIWFNFGIGFQGGLEINCSQAFGSKKYGLLQKHFIISRVFVVAFYVFVVLPLIYFSEKIFLAVNIEHELAINSSLFSKYMTLSILFDLLFSSNSAYLQSMDIYGISSKISVISLIYYPFLAYYFTIYLDLELLGVAIASTILNFISFLVTMLYILYFSPYPKSVPNHSLSYIRKSMTPAHIKRHLEVAIPAMSVYMIDQLNFNATEIAMAYVGAIELAANTCFINIYSIVSVLSVGLLITNINAIGNCAGNKSARLVRRYTNASLFISILLSSCIILALYFFQDMIISFYTDLEPVKASISQIILFYYVFVYFDSLSCSLNGVLHGLGDLDWVAKANIFQFTLFTVPLLVLMNYLNYGLEGIWVVGTCNKVLSFLLNGYRYLVIDLDSSFQRKQSISKDLSEILVDDIID